MYTRPSLRVHASVHVCENHAKHVVFELYCTSTTQTIANELFITHDQGNQCHIESRHTIVCRAAQEAGARHSGYINRKKENVIFTPLYLGDPLSDCNQICCRVARQLGESTFQI